MQYTYFNQHCHSLLNNAFEVSFNQFKEFVYIHTRTKLLETGCDVILFCQQLLEHHLPKSRVSGPLCSTSVTLDFGRCLSTLGRDTTLRSSLLQVGSAPECILYDLHPGTIYYTTVGIWKDMHFAEYQETSEIISFKTSGN